MLKHSWMIGLSALLVACGGAQDPDESTSSEAAGGDCSYQTSDPCIDDGALRQCQQMAAQCPGQVQVMESCPLQFSCPGGGGEMPNGDEPVGSDDQSCEGHTLGDACVDDDAFAQCQEMSAQCPGQVQALESCPLQFACP